MDDESTNKRVQYPIGLMPKRFHTENVKIQRFNDVCGAISRYYNAGLIIDIEWIEEYNELIGSINKTP